MHNALRTLAEDTQIFDTTTTLNHTTKASLLLTTETRTLAEHLAALTTNNFRLRDILQTNLCGVNPTCYVSIERIHVPSAGRRALSSESAITLDYNVSVHYTEGTTQSYTPTMDITALNQTVNTALGSWVESDTERDEFYDVVLGIDATNLSNDDRVRAHASSIHSALLDQTRVHAILASDDTSIQIDTVEYTPCEGRLCSNAGVCVEGTCDCFEGHAGYDCQLVLTAQTRAPVASKNEILGLAPTTLYIIGGAAGGVVLLLLIGGLTIWCRKTESRNVKTPW